MTDLFELEAPLDDQGTTEAGPAHMRPSAPLSQLTRHWEAARGEFDCANMFAGHPDIESHIAELLALGAIRAVYWLALGGGRWRWPERSPSGGQTANRSTDWGRPSNEPPPDHRPANPCG